MTDTGARRRRRAGVVIALLAGMLTVSPLTASAATDAAVHATDDSVAVQPAGDWLWPAQPFRLVRPFVAPAHEYGPGHRGIDLQPLGGDEVRAPAAGVVAFSGPVAGRGVLTIDHGGGLVSTLEPVDSDLAPGTAVTAGSPVGRLSRGGHAPAGSLHFGVRLDGRYINPLALLGGIPRAILLPCC
jgi:murein DD-endopeptidase MepM/ murein hydrolase activator NlpD